MSFILKRLKNFFFEEETVSIPINARDDDGVIFEYKIKTNSSSVKYYPGYIESIDGDRMKIAPYSVTTRMNQFDFKPAKGDLVKLLVKEDHVNSFPRDTAEFSILNMIPFKTLKGTGTITYLDESKSTGFIEKNIYFDKNICEINFENNFGDKIAYKAIQCQRENYKWRAYLVNWLTKGCELDEITDRSDLINNKNGISIRGNFNFGRNPLGSTVSRTIDIVNMNSQSVILKKCAPLVEGSQFRVTEREKLLNKPIPAGDILRLNFECECKYLGYNSEVQVFHFSDFKIGKEFEVEVFPKDDSSSVELNPKEAKPRRKKFTYSNFDLTDAVFAKRKDVSRFNKKPGRQRSSYKTPDRLFKLFLGEGEPTNTTKAIFQRIVGNYPYLLGDLNMNNYNKRFHTLLHLEEIQDKITMAQYNLYGVILRKHNGYITLEKSELPTVFPYGTVVVVTQPWSDINTCKHVGYIQRYWDGAPLIQFHESFYFSYDESKCDVAFQPSRSSYIRYHTAIDLVQTRLGMDWLFPSFTDTEPKKSHFPKTISEWFSPELNQEQREAVRNALNGWCQPFPYVIFGPPGTGKTVTLVELILQLYTLDPKSCLLICTPSNRAADVICEYLIESEEVTPEQMVRVLSNTRAMTDTIPENVIPYCVTIYDEEVSFSSGVKSCKDICLVEGKRIVVANCTAVGVLQTLDQGHFSHIIIDEAAQTHEPEAMIPISFLDPKRGQLILSGDSEQLGPVCINSLNKMLGLSRSFFERIIKMAPYQKKENAYPQTCGFDPKYISKLRVNYRSVPEILTLPSRLFYNSELIPSLSQETGPEAEIIKLLDFKFRNRKSPAAIIFHAVRSKCLQESNGFSWYNPMEIHQSMLYLSKFYDIGLEPHDVGIITPYFCQARKIRELLDELNLPKPLIGSVESFQGAERNAIILSTVRSGDVKLDDRQLGFVACPRRVNVAITRSRAILVIIGNPYSLRFDPYWAEVIRYCKANNSYTGCQCEELDTN